MTRVWARVKAQGGPPRCAALRLLSIPGRSHENKYFGYLLAEMERRGVEVVPPKRRPLALFRYDVLQLNFPTHQITENGFFKACLLSILLAFYLLAARVLGRTIIYTVHDVIPLRARHAWLLRVFLGFVHGLVNGYVFLSHSSRDVFAGQHPSQRGKPWVLAPHGPYQVELLTAEQRAAQRNRLGLGRTTGGRDAFLVGFLGAIKPYKNIDALRDLPAQLADGRPVHVVVAGRVEAGHEDTAARALATLPAERQTRLEHRLSDAELDCLIQAVDVVLLPYARGSNSGAALLVLSNHGRVVGSGLGIFQELAGQVGRPWAYAIDPALTDCGGYAGLVGQAAAEQPSAADRQELQSFLGSIDWSVAAHAVDRLCRSLRSRTLISEAPPPVLASTIHAEDVAAPGGSPAG